MEKKYKSEIYHKFKQLTDIISSQKKGTNIHILCKDRIDLNILYTKLNYIFYNNPSIKVIIKDNFYINRYNDSPIECSNTTINIILINHAHKIKENCKIYVYDFSLELINQYINIFPIFNYSNGKWKKIEKDT